MKGLIDSYEEQAADRLAEQHPYIREVQSENSVENPGNAPDRPYWAYTDDYSLNDLFRS